MNSLHRQNRELDLEAIAAFEARQDARDARRLARLTAEGHTHAVCSCCGEVRTLAWVDGECNNYDAGTDDQMCPGTYRAAKTVTLTNPAFADRAVSVRVGDGAA